MWIWTSHHVGLRHRAVKAYALRVPGLLPFKCLRFAKTAIYDKIFAILTSWRWSIFLYRRKRPMDTIKKLSDYSL